MLHGIHLEIDGPLARITLARPTRLNAVDFAMGAAYRDACVAATTTAGVKAIVVRAEGVAFCAGGDVVTMATAGAGSADVTAAAHVINQGIRALTSCAVPVIAAARGAVAGAGIGLLLAADAVVAAPTLRVAGKYADVGLTPDLGVSALLTQAVGERRALDILIMGRELDTSTAHEWGIVNEIADDPDARAEQIAQRWIDGASGAYGQAKRLVRAATQRTFAQSLEDEAATIGAAYATDEAQERIRAFARASAKRESQR